MRLNIRPPLALAPAPTIKAVVRMETKATSIESLFGGQYGAMVETNRFGQSTEAYMAVGAGKCWACWKAIDLIAKAVIATPFSVVRKGTTTPVKNPDLDRLFAYPNQQQTFRDLLYQSLFHYRLTGMAIWYKSEATLSGDRPKELYALNPRYCELVPSPVRGFDGVLYRINGKAIPFDIEELIVFKRPHPTNDVRGMGDIEAGESLYDEFINRASATDRFYQNGAMPSGVLLNKAPQTVDPEDWKKVKAEWNKQYSGKANVGKTAMLTGDWSYARLGLTGAEQQQLEVIKLNVEQIFQQHGVPLSVAGVREAANYATADIDMQRFKEFVVLPDLMMLQDTINTDLVSGFIPNAVLLFAVQGLINAGKIITELAPLFDRGGLTINEFRKATGLPEDPANPMWDQTFIQSGLMPLDLATVGGVDVAEDAQAIQAAAPSGQGVEQVQDTALNGAQVTALSLLAEQVANGVLPLETARAIAIASFPMVSATIIDAIFRPLKNFEASKPEPAPNPFQPAKPDSNTVIPED